MTVAIVDYGSGNLRSAAKAFERAVSESAMCARVVVTADADEVTRAERVVLPGVGAFADCLASIDGLPDMRAALHEVVINAGRPFLGICVGMQLMAEFGHENGFHRGLGWLQGEVIGLRDGALKVPHMGWNEIVIREAHPVLTGLEDGTDFYFVHSYHFIPDDQNVVISKTNYGKSFVSAVKKDNIYGVQFHPEKSQNAGLQLLKNFCTLT